LLTPGVGDQKPGFAGRACRSRVEQKGFTPIEPADVATDFLRCFSRVGTRAWRHCARILLEDDSMKIRTTPTASAVLRPLARITVLAAAVLTAAAPAALAQDRADPPAMIEAEEEGEPNRGNDAWITAKVKAALLAARDVPGTAIEVRTATGVVTLVGSVETQAQIDEAVELAENINGVRSVDATGLELADADGY
jgi:hyperosmotically inducible periplasmic protein